MECYLDGTMMDSRETVHDYIIEQIELPYGHNLDALYDILTAARSAIIHISNVDAILENLGNYGYMLIKVFKDAARENSGLTLIFE